MMDQQVDCIELMTVDGRSDGQPPVYVSSVLVPISMVKNLFTADLPACPGPGTSPYTGDTPNDRFCDWDDFVDAFEDSEGHIYQSTKYHRMCVAGSVLAQLRADPRCKAIGANTIPTGYTISRRHLRLLLDD
jgi:hypothetical protein